MTNSWKTTTSIADRIWELINKNVTRENISTQYTYLSNPFVHLRTLHEGCFHHRIPKFSLRRKPLAGGGGVLPYTACSPPFLLNPSSSYLIQRDCKPRHCYYNKGLRRDEKRRTADSFVENKPSVSPETK